MTNGVMLILPGVAHIPGHEDPHGLLDRPSAKEYARRIGYDPEVLDVPGSTSGDRPQVGKALVRIRDVSKPQVTALYGFSGGGFNAPHIWERLTDEEKRVIRCVIIIGAPGVQLASFKGCASIRIVPDPPKAQGGHMAGPKVLLEEMLREQEQKASNPEQKVMPSSKESIGFWTALSALFAAIGSMVAGHHWLTALFVVGGIIALIVFLVAVKESREM